MTPEGADPRGGPIDDTAARLARDRRRRSGLLNHFLIFFAVMVVLVPINFLISPDYVWFVFPLVAWGAPLALHTAYAMGLFDGLGRGGR